MQTEQEFKDLIPPLTDEEFAQLEASLLAEGCRDALVVWAKCAPSECGDEECSRYGKYIPQAEWAAGDGIWECPECGWGVAPMNNDEDILLDGHNRLRICEEHDIGYETCEISLPSRDAAKAWIIRNQFARRNLTLYQRAELALKLEPLIAAKAKAKESTHTKQGYQKSGNPVHTDKELAKAAGVSHDTIAKVKYLEANTDKETQAKVRSGEVSINAAYDKARPHVSHNSGENEWYTPPEYIQAARKVMGGIDCDPASSAIANETVKATVFYTAEQDGLKQRWGRKVFCNPPYAQPLMAQFAEAVASRIESGEVRQAIVLVNNATDTVWFHRLLEVAASICLVRKRIRFLDPQGKPGAPLQGQAFLYCAALPAKSFHEQFKQFGAICDVVR